MTDARLAGLIERAFDYRGFVTVYRHDGSSIVGYLYARGDGHVEMFDERATDRIRIEIADIADVVLTGDDPTEKARAIWERRQGTLERRETSPWGEWGDRPVLFLVAMPIELTAVARALGVRAHGDLVQGMVGDRRAIGVAVGVGGGAEQVIAAHRPGIVVSCGFAGAVDAWLRTGDLVLATRVRDECDGACEVAGPVLGIARRALDSFARIREGEIVCTTRVAASRDDKCALAGPGRLAVDLESAAVARAAARAEIPWIVVRVVLDPLHEDLPAFTRDERASYLGAALRHAVHSPTGAIELARLAVRARVARRALERALTRLAPVLGGVV